MSKSANKKDQYRQPVNQVQQPQATQQTDSVARATLEDCVMKLSVIASDHDKQLADHNKQLADHDRLFVTFDRRITKLDERVDALERGSDSGKTPPTDPAPAKDTGSDKDTTAAQPTEPQPTASSDVKTQTNAAAPQPGQKTTDYRMEQWFTFWDFQNKTWSKTRKRNLFSAKAAGGGQWEPVWVWTENGEYLRDLTPVEVGMFAP